MNERKSIDPRERLIFALDVPDLEEALRIKAAHYGVCTGNADKMQQVTIDTANAAALDKIPEKCGAVTVGCTDVAGVVEAVGEGVTHVKPGDRVMALLHYGGMAEYAVAEESDTWAIPETMSWDDASAFPVAYLSSDVALRWQGRLEAGETLLVLGAAGGVGLTAVEIGRARARSGRQAAAAARSLLARLRAFDA